MKLAPRSVYDARNRVMVRLYREHEWTLAELAEAFDMGAPNVHRILKRLGATLDRNERRNRWTAANREKAKDPAYRALVSASIREIWATLPKGSGRPVLFEDDPDARAEYLRLQRKVGAAEARRILADQQGKRAA